jgi:phosphoribosylanthranilate isomerase
MFVKICGIATREDALAAVDYGARALGFIFHPGSPRCVDASVISGWIGEIPRDIWKVGVWVNESPETIEQVCGRLRLDVAQLHGSETPGQYPANVRVWKAIRVTGSPMPTPDSSEEALLLDGPGNGRTFDWPLAAGANRPVVLAGGLTPENVRAAIEAVNPWGVDTASGVEISPGRKDHIRMKSFIEAALFS